MKSKQLRSGFEFGSLILFILYACIYIFCVVVSKDFFHEDDINFSYRVSKLKLATVVEGDQKAPFSIATTLRCRGGAPFYPWYASHIAECLARRYQVLFLIVFGTTRPRIEPRSPGPLANTLPIHIIYTNFNGFKYSYQIIILWLQIVICI